MGLGNSWHLGDLNIWTSLYWLWVYSAFSPIITGDVSLNCHSWSGHLFVPLIQYFPHQALAAAAQDFKKDISQPYLDKPGTEPGTFSMQKRVWPLHYSPLLNKPYRYTDHYLTCVHLNESSICQVLECQILHCLLVWNVSHQQTVTENITRRF